MVDLAIIGLAAIYAKEERLRTYDTYDQLDYQF